MEEYINITSRLAQEEGASSDKNFLNEKLESFDVGTIVPDEGVQVPDSVKEQAQTWDAFILLSFLVAALLYGMSLGRNRIIIIMLAVYMTLAVVSAVPDLVLDDRLNTGGAFQAVAFITVFIILFFLISRSSLLIEFENTSIKGGLVSTGVFSLLHIGLLLAIAFSFIPSTFLEERAPFTQSIFASEWAFFAWIIAPIVAMVVFGREARKKKEED